jgi:hypothetical protein
VFEKDSWGDRTCEYGACGPVGRLRLGVDPLGEIAPEQHEIPSNSGHLAEIGVRQIAVARSRQKGIKLGVRVRLGEGILLVCSI